MNPQIVIPAPDPMPLPAPYALFMFLLVFTFLLHIVAMNFMFGSGILAIIAHKKAKVQDIYARMYKDIVKKIPSLLAATITLGVAPLLFLQVLYGQFFYTSSLIMAWPWFSIVVLLVLAYYGFYIVSFKQDKKVNSAGWVLLLSVFLVLIIGFFYSNNLTLMETPAKYASKYLSDPSGMNLNLGDPTLFPRYLHFILASIAIGGLFVGGTGFFRWKSDAAYAREIMVFGGKWFNYATMGQYLIGLWFLLSLPSRGIKLFMGGSITGTVLFALGFIGGILAIILMAQALKKDDPRKGFKMSAIISGVVVGAMAVMREVLREAYLGVYYISHNFDTATQWIVLSIFIISFIGGVWLWIMMFRRYFKPEKVQ